jgi:hypothetical protein
VLEATPRNGGRNYALFLASCRLGKYAHHGVLVGEEIKAALLAACRVNGLVQDDGVRQCLSTIASGFRSARNDPLPVLRERAA